MDYNIAYDLDGVLCEAPLPPEKSYFKSNGAERRARKQYLLDFHPIARQLLIPMEDKFLIITARKRVPVIMGITNAWLAKHLPHKDKAVHFLSDGRTLKNVIAFKTSVLAEYNIQEFTEDNEQVLRGVRKNLPNIKLWLYKDGQRHIYP